MASAAVWQVKLEDNKDRKTISSKVFSRGLRNSMALSIHPESGLVIQGENGIDLPDADRPFEELNILVEDKHYGWPFCHMDNQVTPKFENQINNSYCESNYENPHLLMPAHSAPLGLLYTKTTKVSWLDNLLLVSWHGYREGAHRIVAYPIDNNGVPTSDKPIDIISDWNAKKDIRPKRAPVGLLELFDGSILVMDDKNGAILRISKGESAASAVEGQDEIIFSDNIIQNFNSLRPYLQKNCFVCHSDLNDKDSNKTLNKMVGTFLSLDNPLESTFYKKLTNGEMPPIGHKDALEFDNNTQKLMIELSKNFLETF